MAMRVSELRALCQEVFQEAKDWFDEGREISRYIMPKNGRFDDFTTPIKKNQSRKKYIINPTATDAFSVLTSGLHGRLTGQNRDWCKLEFASTQAKKNSFLGAWLSDTQKRLHRSFNMSNFYEVMPILYKECSGFGTCAMHIGDSEKRVFNFDLMTFGEYAFILSPDGTVDKFFRKIEMSIRQMQIQYGTSKLPPFMRDIIKNRSPLILQKFIVIQCVYVEAYMDKPIRSVHFLEGGSSGNRGAAYSSVNNDPEASLRVSGYYEFPVPVARWDVVGSYPMGIGLGSDVLPLSKRLQEMDKSFMMATHKAVDPPMNIPSKMRGSVNLLPGGRNYSTNPDHKIEAIVNAGFEYVGVSNASERIENHIQKMCYNDVFLTGMRDPNASPLKARQVDAQEDEGVMRLGPMVGRIYKELLTPTVGRCLGSMFRRGLLLPIDPEILLETGGINVVLIGPLAQQQKLIEVRSIQNFFSFVGGLVPFDDSARDKINIDRTIDEVADMTGVPSTILATDEELQTARKARMQAAMETKQKQDAVLKQQMNSEQVASQATAAKDYAAAGVDIQSVLGGGGGL